MTEQHEITGKRQIDRMATGIPGFDVIIGGGLPTGRSCLITGTPGTGKTTFGNQMAFAHAASGGRVIVMTLLTESHNVLLENLQEYDFFDARLVGTRIHYMSVMTPLQDGGIDAVLDTLRHEVLKAKATLLVIDGTAIDDVALSGLVMQEFAHRLDTQAAFLGCTSILLTGTTNNNAHASWARVNGVILLTNRIVGSKHVRELEVIKMRAARSTGGVHEFSITEAGITIFPRLEALTGTNRSSQAVAQVLGTGVPGLDAMLGGGVMPCSSTLVMGTSGAGKTILGLHYLMEGAERGERGVLFSFHETVADLISTAERIGLDLRRHIESGLIRVIWDAPLELSADGWAWKVLHTVEEQSPSRIYIDALTDLQRVITDPGRMALFTTAFVNELRNRGTTALFAAGIDEYTADTLAAPIPAAFTAMDNCILLRHVELRGE